MAPPVDLAAELCTPKRCVRVLAPSATECGFIWRRGLYRGDQVTVRSLGWDPDPTGLVSSQTRKRGDSVAGGAHKPHTRKNQQPQQQERGLDHIPPQRIQKEPTC